MREISMSNYLNDRIKQHQNSLKKCGGIAIIIILIAVLSIPIYQYVSFLIFVYLISLAVVGFKANSHYSAINIFRAGLQGETALKQTLSSLSDDFVAFYNVPINNSGDIDCILIGHKGVFAIEIKNHKGTIIYSENGWKQIKTGQGGSQYQGHLTNPGKQLLTNMHKFKTFLAENNIHVWIQPVLVFTNPGTNIVLEKDPTPIIVCKVEDILSVINNSDKTIQQKLLNRICDLLQNSVKTEFTKS